MASVVTPGTPPHAAVPVDDTPDGPGGIRFANLTYDVPFSATNAPSRVARLRSWALAKLGRGGGGVGGAVSVPRSGPLLPTHDGAVAATADMTTADSARSSSSSACSSSSSNLSPGPTKQPPAAVPATAPSPSDAPAPEANTRILHGVSGVAPAGQLTVLLGPSGAGKTSLLNLLAGRSQYGPSGGTMTFDGAPRSRRLRRQLAYCMQDDIFSPRLTVTETLQFTARLRIRGLSRAERDARVTSVIKQLRLEACADTLMGDGVVLKGVSGGERKRVNIANELLTDPSTMLLDEPTSGLDSATALTVVKLLRSLADEGRTIITTLHQPSSQMLELFDNIMLLSLGRVVYSGAAADALSYFESVGFPCPVNYNPCDFFLQLLTDTAADGSQPVTRRLEAGWAEREATTAPAGVVPAAGGNGDGDTLGGGDVRGGRLTTTSAGAVRAVRKRLHSSSVQAEQRKYPVNWWTQVMTIGKRSFIQRRGELLEWVQMLQIVAVSFLVGIMWFQLEQVERTLDERVSLVFFICVFFSFIPMFSAIFSMPAEGPVLHKERSSGAYRLSAFFVAKTIVETPVELLYPTLFTIVAYWMAGLRASVGAFVLHVFVLSLVVLTALSIGLFVSATVRNIKLAQVLGSLTVLLALLAGGYYVNNKTLPSWIVWVNALSFIKYGFEALLIIEVRGRTFPCSTVPTIYSGGLAGTSTVRQCPVTDEAIYRAREVADEFGVWGNVGVLLLWIVVFRVAAYLSLKWLHVSHKPSRRAKAV